jgi:hypothetical protein
MSYESFYFNILRVRVYRGLIVVFIIRIHN